MDVQRIQESMIRIIRINKGTDRSGIKGAVSKKTCRLPTHSNPWKRKKSILKRRLRKWGVVPQIQPPILPKSMHPRLSPLWAVKDRQVANASRTRVSQPLEVVTNWGQLLCDVWPGDDLEDTWWCGRLISHLTRLQRSRPPQWPVAY